MSMAVREAAGRSPGRRSNESRATVGATEAATPSAIEPNTSPTVLSVLAIRAPTNTAARAYPRRIPAQITLRFNLIVS
jgi:hypothetical protein